nr:facilitated trehalose transporter Tret1-like [Leptinotarsa decemlineata]
MEQNMVDEKEDFEELAVTDEAEEEGEDWPQIVAILIGCFSSLTTGMLYTWPSPFILKIAEDDNYSISEDEAAHFSTIPSISMMLFCPLSSKLCDIIGRRGTLLLSTIPYTLCWLLKVFARNIYVFYLARFLAGVGDGIVIPSLAMYMGEISTPKVRGIWGNSMTASMYLGELAITVIGNYFGVQQTSYICAPVILTFAVFFWFMPESPYFYIMEGRYQEAKNSLRIFRRKKKINKEFNELKAAVERQISESGTWRDLFLIASNRRALIAGVFLRMSQLLGGSSVFIAYTMYIFKKSGGNVSSEASSIIYMTLCFFLNVCASFTMDIMGRKIAYIASLLPCAVVLLLESVYFYVDKELPDVNVENFKWFPLAGMVMYIIFSSYGIGIVPSLMLGELFSASIKAKGICILTFVFGIMLFVSNYIFYVFHSAFGLFAPFLFFSVCNFVSAFLVYFLVPETKGKTLEEIQQDLKKGKLSSLKELKPFLGEIKRTESGGILSK